MRTNATKTDVLIEIARLENKAKSEKLMSCEKRHLSALRVALTLL